VSFSDGQTRLSLSFLLCFFVQGGQRGDAPDLYVCKVKYALPMISEEGVGVGFWEVVSSWGLVGWGGSLAGLQILMHFVQCADMQLHALIAVADARLLGLWV